MSDNNYSFLQGGGSMGEAIRQKNWEDTPLGAPGQWPVSLKIAAGIMLDNPFPMYIAWGKEYIQLYNDGYRPILGSTKHPQALGIGTRETFAEIWDTIGPMFAGVMEGTAVRFPDFRLELNRHGYLEECFFDFAYSPIKDEAGKTGGVLVTVIETTHKKMAGKELQLTKEKLEQANAISEKEKERLRMFFMQAPAGICILDGPDFVFELVNPVYQEFFPGRPLLGKPLLEALPDLKDQPIYEILQDVYHNKKSFSGREMKVPLPDGVNTPVRDRYFNFIYDPRINEKGETDGVMVFVYEVTDLIVARQQLQESELRFRNIVSQSPVPILVTMGENLVFEEFNKAMLELLNKDESIRGKAAYEILPELRGQPIMDALLHTYRTGEEWTGNEYPIALRRNGETSMRYFNLSYKPFITSGEIRGVLQSAVDVTEQVQARKAMEKTEDALRLSMKAGRVGRFDLDLEKETMHWDERCRELFGINHDNPVSYKVDFVNGLHPDDRDRVLKIINEEVMVKAISNGHYDVEYRTVGASDEKLRWVRAMGKVYFNLLDVPIRFIGTVIDITETKEDELRKNDFIGMVSHELKTPLSSLKAYLQILLDQQVEITPAQVTNMLHKADNQVNKMNHLIRGFLDIARLESGKIVLHKTRFDLATLIEETIQDVTVTSSGHRIEFSNRINLEINADRDKIASVVTNLLNNAIKYSETNSTIGITYKIQDHQAKVLVSDEGVGIRQVHLPHLFERFYRVEDGNSQAVSGFGIGLYLSAEIIQRHGGKMSVESEYGKGSVFGFSLPLD